MPCNLATVQAAACTSGIGKLTDPVHLLQVIAELSCELAVSVAGSQTPWTQNINAAGFNISNLGLINGVKVYRALLNQTGTADPVATVLENTLGGTVVWTRTDVGTYLGTLAGAFTALKTHTISNTIASPIGIMCGFQRVSANAVELLTFDYEVNFGTEDAQWVGTDSVLGNFLCVQILVYS